MMRFKTGTTAAIGIFCASILLLVASTRAQNSGAERTVQMSSLPTWAYPVPLAEAGGAKLMAAAQDKSLMHVPGSTAGYTKEQIADLFIVPDWFPESHPPMLGVVSKGRKPDVAACAYCHLPNGQGRPENASVVGLPAAYMMEQMDEFKNGLRKSSEPRMMSVAHMISVAKGATPDEVKTGVEYFAAMKPTAWIRVIETAMVPKTRIAGGMLVLDEAGGTEPIGERVIEVPENLEQTELRNSKSGFVAYVPVGSLKRGEMLVKTGGNGETLACTMCHGPNLKGLGNVPSIVGRSPSQMTRQIIDFQSGARNGVNAALMKGTVSKLTMDDIVSITGYLASQAP
jgi:cytochrome c553